MAYVTPTTRADGYVVDAAEWNKNTVDNPIALRTGAVAIAAQAANDVVYASSATQLARLAAGTSGQVLTTQGAGSAPTWTDAFGTEQTTTATGGQDNFAPSVGAVVNIRCTGAAPNFTGFSGGTTGRIVRLFCLGTTLKVTNQATSTAANQIICASTNGQIVGVGGVIQLVYDGTTSRWRAFLLEAGAPITVAHAAGDFTGNGSMTWTVAAGDLNRFTYQQLGRLLKVSLVVFTSTVGGTPSTALQVAIPDGFTATSTSAASSPAFVSDNGTEVIGRIQATATLLQFFKVPTVAWTASTDATGVLTERLFDVN